MLLNIRFWCRLGKKLKIRKQKQIDIGCKMRCRYKKNIKF